MVSIELYINKQLCELENAENFSVYLKRTLLNPAELSTKDAQRSYDVTLPATAVNNAIFGYTNTEEVKGKFSELYDAQLIVAGVLILDGKFKMSEITKTSYKGNLGIPAQKTVKDIFGDMKMNEAGKWQIPFRGVEDITTYNTGGHEIEKYGDISPCIFPFILYGLLPKKPLSIGGYSAKNVFDDTVVLGIEDIPPSVNCLHMLNRIFKNANYKLTGTAIDDERLKKLYVSYKNPNEYSMPWSADDMKISGRWGVHINGKHESNIIENLRFESDNDAEKIAGADLFDAYNINITDKYDPGNNIEIENNDGLNNITLTIPQSGLYKIKFNAQIKLTEKPSGMPSNSYMQFEESSFNRKYELKLLRNQIVKEAGFDNTFYLNNLKQNIGGSSNIYPKAGGVNFIDPYQNSNFLCGFSWGYDSRSRYTQYYNPVNTEGIKSNPMAVKYGKSWSLELEDTSFSAVKSEGYIYADGTDAGRFKVDMKGEADVTSKTEQLDDKTATGEIYQIVWLNENDTLSILDMSSVHYGGKEYHYMCNHEIEFSLSIEPFRRAKNWLLIDEFGSGEVDWDAATTFLKNEIDLMKFLPEDIKINDWIDNFCKAFNLSLIDVGDNVYELNIKDNAILGQTHSIIDLDNRANVVQQKSQSLHLPSVYDIGFTIDTNEEGYYSTIEDYIYDDDGNKTDEKVINAGYTGGGKYNTGSTEEKTLSQTSSFSYCWYKKLIDKINETDDMLVPVISDKEVWDGDFDYTETKQERYTNMAQRFWYQSDKFFQTTVKGKAVDIAFVSNDYQGDKSMVLDYEYKKDSILKNYFLLLVDYQKNYTMIDCFLLPEEYANLNNSLVRFNGDLYIVAECDGYDIMSRKKATLKLIRKTL